MQSDARSIELHVQQIHSGEKKDRHLRARVLGALFKTRKAPAASLPPTVQRPLRAYAPLHSPNTTFPRVGGRVSEIWSHAASRLPQTTVQGELIGRPACEKRERKLGKRDRGPLTPCRFRRSQDRPIFGLSFAICHTRYDRPITGLRMACGAQRVLADILNADPCAERV